MQIKDFGERLKTETFWTSEQLEDIDGIIGLIYQQDNKPINLDRFIHIPSCSEVKTICCIRKKTYTYSQKAEPIM